MLSPSSGAYDDHHAGWSIGYPHWSLTNARPAGDSLDDQLRGDHRAVVPEFVNPLALLPGFDEAALVEVCHNLVEWPSLLSVAVPRFVEGIVRRLILIDLDEGRSNSHVTSMLSWLMLHASRSADYQGCPSVLLVGPFASPGLSAPPQRSFSWRHQSRVALHQSPSGSFRAGRKLARLWISRRHSRTSSSSRPHAQARTIAAVLVTDG